MPVLIENHIAVWSESLPSKMKNILALHKVKGGPCIHTTNIYKARYVLGTVRGTRVTAVNKAEPVPDLPWKHN